MDQVDIYFKELPARGGVIGQIVLNRGSTLNALSLSMLSEMRTQLSAWQSRDDVHAVMIKSDCAKAFCAGGDVRSLYQSRHLPLGDSHPYFTVEYSLNKLIYHFTKPYIAFLDGITMGGGVGISLHGSHRVATENCLWAMPESKIGLFPDVGASHALSRCSEMLGWYLALSGRSIDVQTAYDLALVNTVALSSALLDIEKALCSVEFSGDPFAVVDAVLLGFHQPPEDPGLSEYYPIIRRCFSQPSCQELVDSLQFENTPWCDELVHDLQQRSPFSLELIFEQLYRAGSMSFDDVIQQDYTLVHHFVRDDNLYEGIRAALIDKDQSPKWNPASLDQVDREKVLSYFLPISESVRLA